MCNACTVITKSNGNDDEDTDNQTNIREDSADVPTTVKSNVGIIVGIVLPLSLIGIGVAFLALRKKGHGHQRAVRKAGARLRGGAARNNPTFDFEEAAAAAAVTDGVYDEIDESGYTYEQPANAYEQPVAQQQPMSKFVHDGMYEMPDQNTNQSADEALSLVAESLVGGGHVMRQGQQQSQMLYDMASASGQAPSNADQQHRQHQDSHALYMSDAAPADAGPQASYSMASATVQGAVYDQATMSTQATYNLAGQRMRVLNGNFVNDDDDLDA